MANSSRRVKPQEGQTYAAVPQYTGGPRPHNPRRSQSTSTSSNPTHGLIAQGVATGAIGGNYGPYSYAPPPEPPHGPRSSNPPSDASATTLAKPTPSGNTATMPAYLWDAKDADDDFMNATNRNLNRSWTIFSARGWMNAIALFCIVIGLLALFIGYPIITVIQKGDSPVLGFNLGGINGTGQVPDLHLPTLRDPDTPQSAYTRTGTDGKKYDLVFSDEFNTDGRTFYPGDDPFWEAVDFHYWPTGDLEWYDPSAITTANGKLVITLSMKNSHELNFESGMLTSWNKICVTNGYIEVAVSLPGSPQVPGLWPGVWTLGNLARAGYGATTEGLWPYSYDSCDLGTFINQTDRNGNPPQAATGGLGGGALSFLPGQRLSACTCPGSDHPGPDVSVGRNGPEIDILEAQIDVDLFKGSVSQSYQTAPFNYQYTYPNATPLTTQYDTSITKFNTYRGGNSQQAVSSVTLVEDQFYNDNAYAPYAIEWWSNPTHREEGYITWFSNNAKTWTVTSDAMGPDPISLVSQRLIPEEPMYMILNQGIAPGFQKQDFKHLNFPSKMYIDYVRVYQRAGTKDGLTCDPPSHPTADYITKHSVAYSNPNFTTWAQAGFSFPRNSLYDGC